MPQLSGKTLGQYQIIESIGSGGTAQIYRAYQPSVKREVVVKVLSPTFRDDPNFVKWFAQEVDVIAHLQHPHIISVYDFGEQDGDVYIVMAYLRGRTLADRIEQSKGGLPDKETIRLFDLIAKGLDYAHSKEVIHRDLKPSNILMDEDGNPYLADFGLAKFTEGKIELTNTMMTGTAAYMAPEIAREGKSTKHGDIYALGVILFEMLTGQLPYQGDTPYNILSAHVHQPIPKIRELRPNLPEPIQAVIDTALAKDPEDRFRSATEMATAFKAALDSPKPDSATGTRIQLEPKSAFSLQRWVLPIVLALVIFAFGIYQFTKDKDDLAPEVADPTEHIAEAITTSTGDTHWTFGCLGNSNNAIVDLECREIKIAVENRFIPYSYILNGTDHPGGMDYEMWWEICTRLHCQPIFIEEKWENILNKIRAGEFDAASGGITITEKREQTLDFSMSYLNIEQQLLVRKGETRFSNIGEFVANSELKMGVLENSTNYDIARQYLPEERIRTYTEYSTVIDALSNGEVSAVITDKAEIQIKVLGIDFQQATSLEFVGSSLSSDQLGIVFSKDSDLVEAVNKVLQDMRANGALDTLIRLYFGSDFNISYDDIGLGAYGQ